MRNPNSPISYLDHVSLNRVSDKHALNTYLQKQHMESEGADKKFIIRPETCSLVRDLVQNLPKRESTILRLRYWDDLTLDEIANHVGMSEVLVKNILTKTLADLRVQILKKFPVKSKARHVVQ